MKLPVRSLLAQSAMAGYSNGPFCRRAAKAGAAIVTLGGYNADEPTYRAAIQAGRRRREFVVEPAKLADYIHRQAAIARTDGVLVFVNLRFALADGLIELCRQLVGAVDGVELNAHCRQREFIKAGGGEALLSKPAELIHAVRTTSDVLPTVVKARAISLPDGIIRMLEDSGAFALHLDLMKPGLPEADTGFLRRAAASTPMPIIGNNSVSDEESFLRMLSNGASMASMGRALLGGPGPIRILSSSKRCLRAMRATSRLTSRGFCLG